MTRTAGEIRDDDGPHPNGDGLAKIPHPIDRALTALDEATMLLVVSGKPTRFAEIQRLSSLAHQLAGLRPAAGVEDVGGLDDGMGNYGFVNGNVGIGGVLPMRQRFNDGADLNREIVMMAQGFLKTYAETERLKATKATPDVRLDAIEEMLSLTELRLKLALAGQDVPEEIERRREQLLQRIGEPTHDHRPEPPVPDPVVPPEPVRGHQADGPGPLDGDRLGEPVAQ